jgi:PAS domain-containing protein
METKPFAAAIVSDAASAGDFIADILQASTEHPTNGKSPDGAILLCNGGARRLYGYEPEEMVGKANSSILYIAEDVEANKPAGDPGSRAEEWQMGAHHPVAAQERRALFFSLGLARLH